MRHRFFLALCGILAGALLCSAPSGAVDYSANLVLGQQTFVTKGFNNTASSATLVYPGSVAIGGGRLYVSDGGNHRVLWWNSAEAFYTGRGADGVIGQADFRKNSANRGGASPSNNTLKTPGSLALDASNNLWVADTENNRVLRFPPPVAGVDATADLVLGQSNFTNNNSGSTADTLKQPNGLAVDASGRVWVGDTSNNRALRYSTLSNGAAASLVLGQADFTSNSSNRGGTTAANTLDFPYGVTVDTSGYV